MRSSLRQKEQGFDTRRGAGAVCARGASAFGGELARMREISPELATLERWYTGNGIVGSAPEAHPPSAENPNCVTMPFIYILWSEKLRKRYVGCSADVQRRLKEHNQGETPFTSGGRPWRLIHTESLETKSEALKRESFLKSGKGRAWLDAEFPETKRTRV